MTPLFTPYGICVATGVLAAILLFRFENRNTQLGEETASLALISIPAGLIGARLLYVLLRLPFYGMIGLERIFFLRDGGFLVYGAMAAVCLAVVIYARRKGFSSLVMLDAVTLPGLLCIAICRLGEGSAGEGLGNWVENETMCVFPFAIQNAFGEMQWAVFILEAAAAFCFAGMLICQKRARPGQRFLRGLTLYAGCQLIFESLRMDSVLKIGFVRVSQVISALILLGVLIYCCVKSGSRKAFLIIIAIPVGAGVIGGLEWALEKTQVSNLIIYLVMSLTALGMILLTFHAIKNCDVSKR